MSGVVAGAPTSRATGVLVVGGGTAGLCLAATLRDLGYAGEITLVGDEPYLPYQRPPLSKGFLLGADDEEALMLRAPEFLSEHRIAVWRGRRVEKLVLRDDVGGIATLEDSSTLRFERLALTTGASARRLPIPGSRLRGVHSLRNIQDAIGLRDAIGGESTLVVIGGGFIGLEVAAAARARGATVTVVESTGRLLERVCAPPLSEHCLRAHRDAGIEVLLGTTVTRLTGDDTGAVAGVELADGTTHPADVVIVAVGAVPTIELARDAGIACQRGVVVDGVGRTSRPGVVAAGDCTVQPHPHLDGELHGIESVNNATEQARIAAHVLSGREPPSRGVPWFWSDQGGLKIQIAGISTGYDDYVVRADADRLTVVYYRQGRTIAADVVNNPRDFMTVKRALQQGHTVDRARAHNSATPLKELVRPG